MARNMVHYNMMGMNTSEDTAQRVKAIKQSFRQLMDGATAQSMRLKGLDYRLNWGVTLPRLRELADETGQDYSLAIALWKEDVRECKILATMLMPPAEMLPEVVDIWMEQTASIEIAEQAAMNLYWRLPYAAEKAYQWLASERQVCQLTGFHILSRLFMNGQEPDERGINEFLDQALVALQGSDLSVRKAAMNSINHFADLALVYKRLSASALRTIGITHF